ncbi:MAG: hypothetical protein Q7R57_07250 [Dehalococcoidales bacterium]|nr:hypothetical protein [Dehalococcoidales bacterium]
MSNSLRVMLASDQPEVRRYLGKMVRDRMGGVVVGEGENAVRALRLARRLRPDMAIIDSCLPHNISLIDIPLSRGAGLDTAQAICAEIPNMSVVLVDSAMVAELYPEDMEGILLSPTRPTIDALARPQERFTFARLLTHPLPRARRGFSDICLAVGTVGLLAGLALIATMFLAYAGFPLLIIGLAGLFAGCIGKLITSLRYQDDTETQKAGGQNGK